MNSIIDSFDVISNRIHVPPDIRNKSLSSVTNSINNNYSKQTLLDQINDLSYSLKVEPLTYVDEKKYYTCVDGAYKIYEQMTAILDKKKKPIYSKTFAWCVANIAMYNWLFRNLIGKPFSGREVEREVDAAIRSPIIYCIKNCLLGTVKLLSAIFISYQITSYTNSDKLQFGSMLFFIISLIINYIKVCIRIYKDGAIGLSPITPII